MNELSEKYWTAIKFLFIPYLVLMFLLLFPLDYLVQSPGGLTEVDRLITVDYNQEANAEKTGTISSTYVMSIPRPSIFSFLLGYFNDYVDTYVLPPNYQTYTNQEIARIDYYDKDISLSASIIVAYEAMSQKDPSIVISYQEKVIVFGKASYLSNYNDIAFGDEFISMIGEDDQVITTITGISGATVNGGTYDFTLRREDGVNYTVALTKNADTGLFGITWVTYKQVDPEASYPVFTVKDTNIGGSSGGLLQTLAVYNMLSPTDITHGLKVAGTGTINYSGTVGNIGAVKQKVLTAYFNHVDVFFMSPDDYNTAVNVCNAYGIDYSGWLVSVATFQAALDYLESLGD